MPLPQPKVPLTDICSVVFNNTLYTYSANAFQALPLEAGGKWKRLPQGEKVTGGVCVGTTPGDPSTASFLVIGGKGSNPGYQGIQKFTYSTGKWESPTLLDPVTQDRLWHGASYINTTDSIFMYAGRQDGSKAPSTETFTIMANAPYTVLSWPSRAPPAINPILLQWSPSEIALIGGNPDNKQVMLFSPERREWFDSGASLAVPIPKDTNAIKAIMMRGDDGSRSLYTFDMTESPNSVKRTVLFSSQDVPVANAVPVSSQAAAAEDDTLERRALLTVNDWPEYNATLAPTATRNGYALAEDHNGMVVFAGGNEEDPLCIFNARQNVWQNATAMLAQVRLLDIGSSSSTISSSTLSTTRPLRTTTTTESSATGIGAAPSETTSATPVSTGGGPVVSTNTILGVVLGAIFGLAILLFAIYWCIQRRRRGHAHAEAGHARRASGFSPDEKDGIGYASDSMAHGLASPGVFRGHQQQGSHSSFSSMAILMGRVNQQKPGLASPKRKLSNHSNHSRSSSGDSTFRAFKSTISKPIPQTSQNFTAVRPPRPDFQLQPPPMREEKGVSFSANTPEPRSRNLTGGPPGNGDDTTRRSSGWNRYWSGGSALNMLGFGNGGNNGNGNVPNNASRRDTVESDGSHYSDRNRITQDSATVPPLQIHEPRASFSRVTTRSPTIAYHNQSITQGMQVQIETQRPVSAVSSMSGYSSGIPASVHEAWDPTEGTKPWGADRAPGGRYNATGSYATPLAPASSTRVPNQQAPMRDDMSWLNLGNDK